MVLVIPLQGTYHWYWSSLYKVPTTGTGTGHPSTRYPPVVLVLVIPLQGTHHWYWYWSSLYKVLLPTTGTGHPSTRYPPLVLVLVIQITCERYFITTLHSMLLVLLTNNKHLVEHEQSQHSTKFGKRSTFHLIFVTVYHRNQTRPTDDTGYCHRRTTSLEQSAAQSQTMWAVMRPVLLATEDIFIQTVRARHSVNCF